jgi:hypothetical protein
MLACVHSVDAQGWEPSRATPWDSEGPLRSKSAGFFIGGGVNQTIIRHLIAADDTTSGFGQSLVLGYGFSQRWSVYAEESGAIVNVDSNGETLITDIDVGTRIHFRSGPNSVVPFLQLALTGRTASSEVGGSTAKSSGVGLTFGGGWHFHLTPGFGLTVAVACTAGKFGSVPDSAPTTEAGSVAEPGRRGRPCGLPWRGSSGRIHAGIVWFAR